MRQRELNESLDLVLDRDDLGNIYCSFSHVVSHYPSVRLDWGYIGPATAELALNVLHEFLPPADDGDDVVRLQQGVCSADAWRLHRQFMADVLVRIPVAGGCMTGQEIREWITEQSIDTIDQVYGQRATQETGSTRRHRRGNW